MIFVTSGTQLPFDRLVRIMDEYAATTNEEVVIQAFADKYKPQHVRYVHFVPPDEFNKLFAQARVIVAHAGMGTILTALQMGKPLIIFPRIAALGEHRNEHQLATAGQMERLDYVYVARTQEELSALLQAESLPVKHTISNQADTSLIEDIKQFILQ